MGENLIKALAVTAEVCGTDFSDAAAKAVVMKLSKYPEHLVLAALDRCQSEITGRLSLAAIIQRIDDGRPGSDEAWSIAINANDEQATIVWTEEIAKAFASARNLLDNGDKVGARMAFRDSYERDVAEARSRGIQPRWVVSLGHDPAQREMALRNAVTMGRLEAGYATKLLPTPIESGSSSLAIDFLTTHRICADLQGREHGQ